MKRFYAEIGIQHLSMFSDTRAMTLPKLAVFGIPATLLIDLQSQEIERLIGPADWNRLEIVAFLTNVIAEQSGFTSSVEQKENSP